MSLAGLRKQLNKASQFVSEKIGGAEGTKLDEDYVEAEKNVETISKLLEEVLSLTQEFLQPNPAYRARMATVNTLNKLQGKSKSANFPQPETQLAECLIKHGRELSDGSCYGQCLVQTGESFKQMADIKFAMEDHVRENFLQPIQNIENHELKEIAHHRKKLEGRRLDFDCKKRRQEKVAANTRLPDEEELKIAQEKFQESKVLAEQSMINFLNCETDYIQWLKEFVSAQVDYHRQATEIMEPLLNFLIEKKEETDSQPKKNYEPKLVVSMPNLNRSRPASPSHTSAVSSPAKNGPNAHADRSTAINGPCCRGLFDFEPENSSELAFAEGDVIRLLKQVDENWFEGELNGSKGYFPINYVEVIRPLP